MSTSPDPIRPERADDRLVTLLSHWLTRQLGNEELLRGVEEVGTSELAPGQTEAVLELASELRTAAPGQRGGLEMVVRETLEALADGV
jgi:hypothetical protein